MREMQIKTFFTGFGKKISLNMMCYKYSLFKKKQKDGLLYKSKSKLQRKS